MKPEERKEGREGERKEGREGARKGRKKEEGGREEGIKLT